VAYRNWFRGSYRRCRSGLPFRLGMPHLLRKPAVRMRVLGRPANHLASHVIAFAVSCGCRAVSEETDFDTGERVERFGRGLSSKGRVSAYRPPQPVSAGAGTVRPACMSEGGWNFRGILLFGRYCIRFLRIECLGLPGLRRPATLPGEQATLPSEAGSLCAGLSGAKGNASLPVHCAAKRRP
jgi:hypothetical protein